MKYILIIAFMGLSAITYAQDNDNALAWYTNLEEAQKVSKKEKKPILLYFNGSDWCAPCKMLKKDFFDTSEFRDRSEEFVLVMIDYPRRIDILSEEQFAYNKRLVAKYNKARTFPKILVLNNKGKPQDEISGYSSLRDTSNHFAFLDRNK
ncbi:MAG: thioredoxin family protein [Bacteroidia bacterium]|nr:thioredoxin family protein [Bacteroidia bacterium]NNF31366.1 thioredoxin family protein [Flavobacteriaceae bacterium]MBT8276558.1 thioredoxin family protein [Bacteroidia bacterium]NNJ82088.1 thioredoxin family protein [Flavobacteriaceae bacterium]NNK54360.1 thioredoxin family protein [Flavobacteriaceae bacterium]